MPHIAAVLQRLRRCDQSSTALNGLRKVCQGGKNMWPLQEKPNHKIITSGRPCASEHVSKISAPVRKHVHNYMTWNFHNLKGSNRWDYGEYKRSQWRRSQAMLYVEDDNVVKDLALMTATKMIPIPVSKRCLQVQECRARNRLERESRRRAW